MFGDPRPGAAFDVVFCVAGGGGGVFVEGPVEIVGDGGLVPDVEGDVETVGVEVGEGHVGYGYGMTGRWVVEKCVLWENGRGWEEVYRQVWSQCVVKDVSV